VKTRYEETQRFHPLLSGLLFAMLIIIPILAILDANAADSTQLMQFVSLPEIFLIFIWVNFLEMKIIVTDEFAQFGFGLFRKKIPLKKIVSCKPFEVRFGQYFGIGIRFNWWNRTILFNTRFGKAVRIKVRGSRRDYVVTTDNQKKLCQVLRK